MPTIGPHTFSVVVNGHPLPEYQPPTDEVDESSEEKKVVYIEVTEALKFEVHCKIQSHNLKFDSGHLSTYLYLDNDAIASRCLVRNGPSQRLENNITFNYVAWLENGSWFERPFEFSNLMTTETVPKLADLKNIARNVGQIRVAVFNMTAPTTGPPKFADTAVQKAVIPEKALKGQPIDMEAAYGQAKATTRKMMKNGSRRIGDPLFCCVFKYRSRKALQMLNILPETPEPVALHERDPNTLNLVEARELLSRIQRQGGLKAVKRESSNVKRECDTKQSPNTLRSNDRKRNVVSITIDDVTSDDDDLIFVEAKKIRRMPTSSVEVLDLS